MATSTQVSVAQSLAEIRIWDFDYNSDLNEGVTVASATATHIPPSGAAATPTVGTIVNGVVPVMIGPLAVMGQHYLSCLATYSNGEKSEIRILFLVNF
ncbi:MAG: hypothetical protein A2Y53_04945 [Chloroflexi bacterium RBG_16_47_49]|nr:MAG: hypothetical protein A2Y53_04945 [Chloroflexi bacterium RBG_16_47_49]